MEVELRAARAASPPAKERDTPPPSPAAASPEEEEGAPLLPGDGDCVRRRAMRERFARRSGSFRRDVGHAAAETFLLTRLTLTLLRYLGIYLVGQSAGAHIAACTLVNQAIKECGEGDTSNWTVGQLKAYFGISGGYNLLNLVDHFHRRGLYRSVFLSIMEGEESLRKFSPQLMVKDVVVRSAVSLLPDIVLFHGTSDCSMPPAESEAFIDALQQRGAKADLFLYEGKTHTDLFLQDPLRGGRDKMLEEIVAMIHNDDPSKSTQDLAVPAARCLVPEFMLMLAGRVSPF